VPSASHLQKLLRKLQPEQVWQRRQQLHLVCSGMLDANQLCHQVHKDTSSHRSQAAH